MTTKRPRVVVVGCSYVDLTVRCEEFPEPNHEVTGTGFSCNVSGSGPLQAITSALCGCDVTLISKVGGDIFGQVINDTLAEHNVETTLVETTTAKSTGTKLTFVNAEGENSTCRYMGTNLAMRSERIESAQVEHAISDADICLVDGNLPTEVVESTVKIADLRGTKVILSLPLPVQQVAQESFHIPVSLCSAEILLPQFINHIKPDEGFFANIQDFKMVGATLVSQNIETVIMGSCKKGCFIFTRDGVEKVKSFDFEVVDHARCKDAFAGALAACVASGDSIAKSVRFASAAAVLAGQGFGGPDFLPKKEDILKLLIEQSD